MNKIKALNPKLPILMLYNGYDPTISKVDGSLHSLETPAAMLDMIRFMTTNIGDSSAVVYPAADRRNPPDAKAFRGGQVAFLLRLQPCYLCARAKEEGS